MRMLAYALDPVVGETLRGCFALLFAISSAHKLRATDDFAEIIAAYRVLPSGLAHPLSTLLPILEISIAAGLLIPEAYQLAALAGALLLSVYAAAIGINLLRGRTELNCGCLGPGGHKAISGGLVARNLIVSILLYAPALMHISSRRLGWVDVSTVAGGICAVALLYAAASTVVGSAHLFKRVAG